MMLSVVNVHQRVPKLNQNHLRVSQEAESLRGSSRSQQKRCAEVPERQCINLGERVLSVIRSCLSVGNFLSALSQEWGCPFWRLAFRVDPCSGRFHLLF